METQSNKSVIRETLHKAFNVFRYLFQDNAKILKKIDEIYEKEIEKELAIIPDAALSDVVDGIYWAKAILSSIDYGKLDEQMKKAPFKVSLRFNVYKRLQQNVSESSVISDGKIKSFVLALIKKCKPILDCFTLTLLEPLKYIDLARIMTEDEMGDMWK